MTSWVHVAGWTLIHFVWQGTLVGLVTAAALWSLRSASAQTRYVVACAALAAMLAAPMITAHRLSAASVDSAPLDLLPSRPAHDAVVPAATLFPTDALARHGVSMETVRAGLDGIMPLVVAVWFAGVACLLLRLTGGWWQVRRLHREALATASSGWQAASERIARRLHLRRHVRVVDSGRIDTPTALGWMRPVVLLPIAALTSLAPAQVEALLAHELAHIRRHDYLVNLWQTMVETLLFYHPAVWWVSGRIRAEREHCCDDVAVSVCGDPLGYATALAELETWRTERPRQLVLAATGGSLLQRVRRLLRTSEVDTRSSSSVLATLIAVLLLVIVVGGRRLPAWQSTDQPAFEAVSVKPFVTRDGRAMDEALRSRVLARGRLDGAFALQTLLAMAYPEEGNLPMSRIIGYPTWSGDYFKISATVGTGGPREPAAFSKALPGLVRTLLADRFKLAVHFDSKPSPFYAVVLARSDGRLGHGLWPSTADCQARRDHPTPQEPPCGIQFTERGVSFVGASMNSVATLANVIAGRFLHAGPVGLPVLDRTNLEGKFDINLVVEPEANALASGNAAIPGGSAVAVSDVLQDQLGLKLERREEPMKVLVIDHVERPTGD